MNTVVVGAAIIAIVRAIKESLPQVNGLVTLLVAIGLGALAGYLRLEGLTVEQGILVGLAAVGTVSVADRIALRA